MAEVATSGERVWGLCYKTVIILQILTHFRLNKLSQHYMYILEEPNFNLSYVRLCDLDIPREKWLNYICKQ